MLNHYTLTFNVAVGVEDGPQDPRQALDSLARTITDAMADALKTHEPHGAKADGHNPLWGEVLPTAMQGLDNDLHKLADLLTDGYGSVADIASALRQIAERVSGDDED